MNGVIYKDYNNKFPLVYIFTERTTDWMDLLTHLCLARIMRICDFMKVGYSHCSLAKADMN